MIPYKTIAVSLVVGACAAPQAMPAATDQQIVVNPMSQDASRSASLPTPEQRDLSNAAKTTRVLWFYGDHGP
jgi:uncharacterized protein YcfL